jgi:hypothetical protein
MSSVPRVSITTRERVSREFDELGPSASTQHIINLLERFDPELLDIISKAARDISGSPKILTGFAFFVRLLILETGSAHQGLHATYSLPRITPETRELLVKKIDAQGTEAFLKQGIEELERNNPELLQVAHHFASAQRD